MWWYLNRIMLELFSFSWNINTTCNNCPCPGVIIDHIIFTFSKCRGLDNTPETLNDKRMWKHFLNKDNSSPNFCATIAAWKIVAKCFNLGVKKPANQIRCLRFVLAGYFQYDLGIESGPFASLLLGTELLIDKLR